MQHFDQIGQCSSKLYKVIARYDKVMQIHGKTMVINSQVICKVWQYVAKRLQEMLSVMKITEYTSYK